MKTMDPVTHVVFDLDGLLIDTETVYTTATNAITTRFGKTFEWEHKVQVMGLPPRESNLKIIEVMDLPLTLEEYAHEIETIFKSVVHEVELMPGAERLVKHFSDHNIPMAIATGSSGKQFGLKTGHLGDFFKLGNYFSHVVTSDDPEVKKGKPAPDCFIACANRFKENGNIDNPNHMKHVLVFEDAPAGVTAALSGGMQCVMVPDPRVDDEVKSKATLSLNSLLDFEPHLFHLPAFS